MKNNWIESSFLSYTVNWFADGTKERRLVAFGCFLMDSPRIEDAVHFTGFRLSCYGLVVLTGKAPLLSMNEAIGRVRTIPLLKLVLGEHTTCEEPDEDGSYDIKIGGKRYTITRYQRWTCYSHFKRWLKIKDSWLYVYSIASVDDDDLPPFSFAHKSWKRTEPSPHQILNQAKELQRLTADFRRKMEPDQ